MSVVHDVVEVRDESRARRGSRRAKVVAVVSPTTPPTEASNLGAPQLQVDTSCLSTETPPPGASPQGGTRADVSLQHRIMRVQVGSWSPAFAMDALLLTISENLAVANDIHVSTVLHRLATIVAGERSLQPRLLNDWRFTDLLRRAQEVIPSACPRAVTTMTWALGKLEARNSSLLAAIALYIDNHLSLLDAQGIANTLYAFALLQFRQERLLLRLTRHLPSLLSSMKPQEMSNAVYALARLGFGSEQALKALRPVTEYIVPRVGSFKTQELSNLVYSHAVLNLYDEAFCQAAERELVDRNFVDWLGQDLSNTVFGFSKLNYRCEKLFRAVRNHGLAFLGQLNLNALSMTLSGFAALNLLDPVLGQVACDHVIACLSARVFTKNSVVTMPDLINVLHALVRFRRPLVAVGPLVLGPIRPDFAGEVANYLVACTVMSNLSLSLPDLATIASLLVKLDACDVEGLMSRLADFISRSLDAGNSWMRYVSRSPVFTVLTLLDVYGKTGCPREDVLNKLADWVLREHMKLSTKQVLEAAFSLTVLGFRGIQSVYKVVKTHYLPKSGRAGARDVEGGQSEGLTCADDCRAIVCFLRGAMIKNLETACLNLVARLSSLSEASDGGVSGELLVVTFRFLGKYRSEKQTAGRVKVAESLLEYIGGRVGELAASDVVTMCEGVGRVRDYVDKDLVEKYVEAVVEGGFKVGGMGVEEIIVVLEMVEIGTEKKEVRTRVVDIVLKEWLPNARLSSEQYGDLLRAINPLIDVDLRRRVLIRV